jgi:hypothetical protein
VVVVIAVVVASHVRLLKRWGLGTAGKKELDFIVLKMTTTTKMTMMMSTALPRRSRRACLLCWHSWLR